MMLQVKVNAILTVVTCNLWTCIAIASSYYTNLMLNNTNLIVIEIDTKKNSAEGQNVMIEMDESAEKCSHNADGTESEIWMEGLHLEYPRNKRHTDECDDEV